MSAAAANGGRVDAAGGASGAYGAMIGKIRSRLMTRRDIVCEKITDYPTPIADADEAFDALIAERERTFSELRAIAALEAGGVDWPGREPRCRRQGHIRDGDRAKRVRTRRREGE